MPEYSGKDKTKIAVDSELEGITDINQLAMTFHGDIKIILRWRDGRITFKDLGINGTFLNKYWRDKIWLPPLYFSNSVGKKPLSTDEGFVVEVLRRDKCQESLQQDECQVAYKQLWNFILSNFLRDYAATNVNIYCTDFHVFVLCN